MNMFCGKSIFLVFLTLFIPTVRGTYLRNPSTTQEISGNCPPYWIFIRGLCLTSGLSRADCDMRRGVYLFELCFKYVQKSSVVQETALAQKQPSGGVYFEGFSRFCCGNGFGK